MSAKIGVPPIKSQGIKTRLIPWIKSLVPEDFGGTWVEPFMGTGAVAFNLAPRRAVLCDANPHLIAFYRAIASGEIDAGIVVEDLAREGALLSQKGETHYYFVRERFNAEHSPLDFLFLNRAGFNGMMRFNRLGGYNVPFCRKPNRFAQAYITKIKNQVSWVRAVMAEKDFAFRCQGFQATIAQAMATDMIYCDPPYIGRHADYYSGWDDASEQGLYDCLARFPGKFILSTWHHNDYRRNDFIESLWGEYAILTKKHFYHVGGKEANRNPVVEALVTNLVTQA
jgi:DNA adenine methylase